MSQPQKRLVYFGTISVLGSNQIFVFGSNPEGRHGKGAAKLALTKFGAKYGQGRGLQGQSYALITKNLRSGYRESATGITYTHEGECSVSKEQIIHNIKELYNLAAYNPGYDFLVAYSGQGTNLNGYTSETMACMFYSAGPIPLNIVFEGNFSNLVQSSFIPNN